MQLLADQGCPTLDSLEVKTNVTSLLGLESLQVVKTLSISRSHLTSLAGLENLSEVSGQLTITNNYWLNSLAALQSLSKAGAITMYNNNLTSLGGLESLERVQGELILSSASITSLSGLRSLRTVGNINFFNLFSLTSLSGLENLTEVRDRLEIGLAIKLSSIAALKHLQTVGSVEIRFLSQLRSLAGLEGLTVVPGEFYIGLTPITSLSPLQNLRSVGLLTIESVDVTSLTGLDNLQHAWGGISLERCSSLRSLQGLGSLHRAGRLRVKSTRPLQVLGGPLANDGTVNFVSFEGDSWPSCVSPHERAALVAKTVALEFSLIPNATWGRWYNSSCGWGLFVCTKGQACRFTFAGSNNSHVESVFLSELHGGCGVCSQDRPRSNVTSDGTVDFGYALRSVEVGNYSICRCGTEVGPVAQLMLRGPRQSPEPTVCTRGSNCTLRIDGEALEPTDHVVLMSSCKGQSALAGFAAHKTTGDMYILHDPATWYAAAPTRYEVCWRAACGNSTTDTSVCANPEQNAYFKAGDVELHGAYPSDRTLVIGLNLSVPNIGFGVSDGDRMRIRRRCGEANEDELETLEAGTSEMKFHFGALTADRVRASSYRLCWCQVREGVECNAERQFMSESGSVDITCAAGQELSGSGLCRLCPAGRQQLEPGFKPCSECLAGKFSLKGAVTCEACPDGTVAASTGSSACAACRVWESADAEAVDCSADPGKMVLPVLLFLCVGVFCALLEHAVWRRLSVGDVSQEEGRAILTTLRSHGLSNFFGRSFPVTLRGTGHPGLDSPSKPFRAWVRDAVRLELLTSEGQSVKKRLDTSMGALVVDLPYGLLCAGWPVPVAFSLPLLFIMAVVLGVAVLFTDMALVALMGAGGSALAGTAVSACVRLWPRRSPLTQRIADYRLQLGLQHRRRSQLGSEKGPDRAVSVGKLHELLEFFRDFIRDRTAYYLDSNILCPLTRTERLSFAELVGGETVEWFVSHYWGTAFEHLCAALQKHAEMVCIDDGRDWRTVSYWVCFCSNNQHQLKEEIGLHWRESSFYTTLQSGHCMGTCMVLDDQALPLTRIWCIFELLQTITLEKNDERFRGLILCTSSGVLNTGSGSVDVAMALAKKVAEMDLVTAQSTSAKDGEMIRAQVIKELGSFDKLNSFVRRSVRDMLLHARRNSEQQFASVLEYLDDAFVSV